MDLKYSNIFSLNSDLFQQCCNYFINGEDSNNDYNNTTNIKINTNILNKFIKDINLPLSSMQGNLEINFNDCIKKLFQLSNSNFDRTDNKFKIILINSINLFTVLSFLDYLNKYENFKVYVHNYNKSRKSQINKLLNSIKKNNQAQLSFEHYLYLYSNLIAEYLFLDKFCITKVKYIIDLLNNTKEEYFNDLNIINKLGILNNKNIIKYDDLKAQAETNINKHNFNKNLKLTFATIIIFVLGLLIISIPVKSNQAKTSSVTNNIALSKENIKISSNETNTKESIISNKPNTYKQSFELKNVPFVSQKDTKIFNGCEAASLLMALKYKEKLLDYDLHKFVLEMPKHDSDPHKGFIYSIYDYEPLDVTHWIAPDALTEFAKNYITAQNISGASVDDLKKHISDGNPIIIYITANFEKPNIIPNQEVPLNLHVVLLTGYNNTTDEYIVLDPYYGRLIIKGENFRTSYNHLKYAVLIK